MIGGLLKAGGFCTDVQFTEGLVEFGGQVQGCSGCTVRSGTKVPGQTWGCIWGPHGIVTHSSQEHC